MREPTDDEYTLRMDGTPRPKNRGTVLDADDEPVLDVVWEGFRGPVWYTFQRPDGTPVFRVETVAASVGPVRFTTRRYRVVEADHEEPLAVLVKRWVGPLEMRYDVESADGKHVGTIASRSRLRGFVRLFPLWWLVLEPPTYDVTTTDGRRVAVILKRHRVFGSKYTVLVPHEDELPWQAVFAAAALHGRAGLARRAP